MIGTGPAVEAEGLLELRLGPVAELATVVLPALEPLVDVPSGGSIPATLIRCARVRPSSALRGGPSRAACLLGAALLTSKQLCTACELE